jgi:hypothetical protein
MTHYKLTKDELEAFARKVYEEACYGYLDLKESACEAMVEDFIDGKNALSDIVNSDPNYVGISVGNNSTVYAANYMGAPYTYTGSTVTAIENQTTYSPTTVSEFYSPTITAEYPAPSLISHHVWTDAPSAYQLGIAVGESVRSDSSLEVRPSDPEFQGNNSERL